MATNGSSLQSLFTSVYEGNLLSIHVGDTIFFYFWHYSSKSRNKCYFIECPTFSRGIFDKFFFYPRFGVFYHFVHLNIMYKCKVLLWSWWSQSLAGLLGFKQYDKKDFKVEKDTTGTESCWWECQGNFEQSGGNQYQTPSPSIRSQMVSLRGPWGTPAINSQGTCWGILEHFGWLWASWSCLLFISHCDSGLHRQLPHSRYWQAC